MIDQLDASHQLLRIDDVNKHHNRNSKKEKKKIKRPPQVWIPCGFGLAFPSRLA